MAPRDAKRQQRNDHKEPCAIRRKIGVAESVTLTLFISSLNHPTPTQPKPRFAGSAIRQTSFPLHVAGGEPVRAGPGR